MSHKHRHGDLRMHDPALQLPDPKVFTWEPGCGCRTCEDERARFRSHRRVIFERSARLYEGLFNEGEIEKAFGFLDGFQDAFIKAGPIEGEPLQ